MKTMARLQGRPRRDGRRKAAAEQAAHETCPSAGEATLRPRRRRPLGHLLAAERTERSLPAIFL